MSRVTLDFIVEYPYIVFGISSTANDYRLCWALNRALSLQLKRKDPVQIIGKNKEEIEHGYFTYTDVNLQMKYRLIVNKRGYSRFMPELAHADFLLVVDDVQGIDFEQMIASIKPLKQVLMLFPIDLEKLRFKQNLLLSA